MLQRLAAVESSGRFTNLGPQEQELRARFAELLGVPEQRIVTVANATLGISGAVAVLGGRRWAVPAFTFPATPAAIMAAGASPVLSEVREQDWTLAATGVEADGWLPVAPFGAPPDIARWSHAGSVVHDAAASLGADVDLSGLVRNQAVVFSLHATKVLGSGEGGLVVLGDDETARRLRAWTNFGFEGSRRAESAGLNAKMSELQACAVHAALDGWSTEVEEWTDARRRMTSMCASFGIRLADPSRNGVNPYTIARFPDAATMAHVETVLARCGVETRRWWEVGCHRMPAYRHLTRDEFPVADRLAGTTLGLPFFRGLTEADVGIVADALRAALVDR